MPEPRKIVAHRFGEEPLVPEHPDGKRALPLGQGSPSRVHEERQMPILWRRGLEPFIHEDLAGRIAQVIFTPQDVAHAHLEIVDRIGKQEPDTAVGAADHKISELGDFDMPGSKYEILPYECAGPTDPPAPDRLFALRKPALSLRPGQSPAAPRVPGRQSPRLLQGPFLGEFRDRAETGINLLPAETRAQVAGVDRGTLRLPVGSIRPTHIGAFLPVETEPSEIG